MDTGSNENRIYMRRTPPGSHEEVSHATDFLGKLQASPPTAANIKHLPWFVYPSIAAFLEKRGYWLFRKANVDPSRREEGRDWPAVLCQLSMTGPCVLFKLAPAYFVGTLSLPL